MSNEIQNIFWASLVPQMVKNLLAMQEAQVRSLGVADTLEKGMAAHSNILTWRIPWTEKSGGLQSMGLQRVGHNWATNTFTFWIRSPFSHDLEKETYWYYVLSMVKVVCITGETHSCCKPLTILSSHFHSTGFVTPRTILLVYMHR